MSLRLRFLPSDVSEESLEDCDFCPTVSFFFSAKWDSSLSEALSELEVFEESSDFEPVNIWLGWPALKLFNFESLDLSSENFVSESNSPTPRTADVIMVLRWTLSKMFSSFWAAFINLFLSSLIGYRCFFWLIDSATKSLSIWKTIWVTPSSKSDYFWSAEGPTLSWGRKLFGNVLKRMVRMSFKGTVTLWILN